MSKYASEFREKADKTAKLLKMARNELIPDLQWKIGEFDKEVSTQLHKLKDPEVCFVNYVRLRREGKIGSIYPMPENIN